ncbi:MAG: DUF2267 domain-containing protein [Bacteroidota bacterium]|nr:DUF2267 domain-containing protein [Bacteroidota bacterium]
MSLDFEKYAAKGNKFVKLVEDELQVPKDKAGRIIRAVLHALRNRLSHEDSFRLLAQLPLALKGIYVDGWKFDKDFTRISHGNDFLDEVRKEDWEQASYDFGNNRNAQKAIAAVFKAMSYFVNKGEFENIMASLPGEIKQFEKRVWKSKETVL